MFPPTPSSIYQSSECFVSYGSMGHIDPKQIPRKSKPWSSIMALNFLHKVELIVPQDLCGVIERKLIQEKIAPCFYRVTMRLEQVLEEPFFAKYIKRGTACMRSDGKTTPGNMIAIKNGVINMYLDKETYERTGLIGKPFGVKGDREPRSRWVVSYDLKGSHMIHGKKGFNRLVHASKVVFSQPQTWLFCNTEQQGPSTEPDPLQSYLPRCFTSTPNLLPSFDSTKIALNVSSAILDGTDRLGLEIESIELYEWLSLIRLASPRVAVDDQIDVYLSRYEVPGSTREVMKTSRISWQGLLSTDWLQDILASVFVHCPKESWFAMCCTEFPLRASGGCNELVLLRPPDSNDEFVMWEVHAAN